MSRPAQVGSVEVIDQFRATLINYLRKARATVEEVRGETQSVKAWLQGDRRTHWEREFRKRGKELEEKKQLLFTAKLSQFRADTQMQLMAVEKAKNALRHAEEKRELTKKWSRDFENRANPLVMQMEQLLNFLTTDLIKATAHLDNVVKSLEAYALVQAPSRSAPSDPANHDSQPPAESSTLEQATSASNADKPAETSAKTP